MERILPMVEQYVTVFLHKGLANSNTENIIEQPSLATTMQFKEALAKLKKDPVFVAWEQENPTHFLAHGFLMKDKLVQEAWQIGFYDKKQDRIVVFTVAELVSKNPPSELFKKDSGVHELLLDEVATDLEEALAAAEEHRADKYREHTPAKTIVLLQKLKSGQVWNISFVTNTFSVCNIKLDTKTLEVKSSSCESLLGWGDAVKGERKKA